jgi:basic membrane protein A
VRRNIRTRAAIASIAVLGIVAAGCAKSSDNTASSKSSSPAAPTFKACMVTDTGGIDDRSFNASSWEGMQQAKKANSSIGTKYLQSVAQSDYAPNINALVNEKCGIIVTVGFLMGDATKAAASANPSAKFAIVDYSYSPALSNVDALIFDTAQAGFLGGYLAAGMSKTGKVATFGGMKLPTVTIFMDGFYDGVQYYNQKKGKSVQVLGWNTKTQNGTFTGDFTDQAKGTQRTNTFIQQGADIVFPVAGNVGLGAAAAAKATNGKVNLLWVDTDGCISAPQYCGVFISSVVKGIQPTVKTAVLSAAEGSFKGGNFVGNLKNDGVGIAPFHQFDSKVPAELKTELAQIRTGIIDGSIPVESPSAPKS